MALGDCWKQLSWFYYQYLLVTALYMLEPWERTVFNSLLISVAGMAVYTGYVFMPQHIMAILHYFEVVQWPHDPTRPSSCSSRLSPASCPSTPPTRLEVEMFPTALRQGTPPPFLPKLVQCQRSKVWTLWTSRWMILCLRTVSPSNICECCWPQRRVYLIFLPLVFVFISLNWAHHFCVNYTDVWSCGVIQFFLFLSILTLNHCLQRSFYVGSGCAAADLAEILLLIFYEPNKIMIWFSWCCCEGTTAAIFNLHSHLPARLKPPMHHHLRTVFVLLVHIENLLSIARTPALTPMLTTPRLTPALTYATTETSC